MAGAPFQVSWISVAGPTACAGCEMADIQPGRRALRFMGGPGRLKRLSGSWYHGWACLAQQADRLSVDEERFGGEVAEAYQSLAQWARQQERAARRPV